MVVGETLQGDCLGLLRETPDESADLILTSPPYFRQRDYGAGGIGNENSADDYLSGVLAVFRECLRVARSTGTVVFNMGDKYVDGSLLMLPGRFAIGALGLGARLVNEITWVKTNPVPRQSSRKLVPSTEPFFVFAKTDSYKFDKEAFLERGDAAASKSKAGDNVGKAYWAMIEKSGLSDGEKENARQALEEAVIDVKRGKIAGFRMKIRGLHALPYGGMAGGRMDSLRRDGFYVMRMTGDPVKKDVIECPVETIPGCSHPAVYPEFVAREIIKLLTRPGDIVLDPFMGSGTTAAAAVRTGRKWAGFEISPEFAEMANIRAGETVGDRSLDDMA